MPALDSDQLLSLSRLDLFENSIILLQQWVNSTLPIHLVFSLPFPIPTDVQDPYHFHHGSEHPTTWTYHPIRKWQQILDFLNPSYTTLPIE